MQNTANKIHSEVEASKKEAKAKKSANARRRGKELGSIAWVFIVLSVIAFKYEPMSWVVIIAVMVFAFYAFFATWKRWKLEDRIEALEKKEPNQQPEPMRMDDNSTI